MFEDVLIQVTMYWKLIINKLNVCQCIVMVSPERLSVYCLLRTRYLIFIIDHSLHWNMFLRLCRLSVALTVFLVTVKGSLWLFIRVEQKETFAQVFTKSKSLNQKQGECSWTNVCRQLTRSDPRLQTVCPPSVFSIDPQTVSAVYTRKRRSMWQARSKPVDSCKYNARKLMIGEDLCSH